jgi:hypothetical protein
VAIAALREAALQRRLDLAAVDAELDKVPELQSGETEILVLVVEAQGVMFASTAGVDRFDTEMGRAAVAGTGKDRLREYLTHQSWNPSSTIGEVRGTRAAVVYGLHIAAQLLTVEHRGGYSASTLRELFGGGYEIAAYDFSLECFLKLPPEMTYVFWDATLNGQDAALNRKPLLLIKQRYLGDVLAIRSAILDGTDRDGRSHRFLVMPMYECARPTDKELEQTLWKSPLYCHCLLVRTNQGPRFHIRVEHEGPGTEPSLGIEESSGRLRISVSPALNVALRAAVDDVYRALASD